MNAKKISAIITGSGNDGAMCSAFPGTGGRGDARKQLRRRKLKHLNIYSFLSEME